MGATKPRRRRTEQEGDEPRVPPSSPCSAASVGVLVVAWEAPGTPRHPPSASGAAILSVTGPARRCGKASALPCRRIGSERSRSSHLGERYWPIASRHLSGQCHLSGQRSVSVHASAIQPAPITLRHMALLASALGQHAVKSRFKSI